MEHSASRALALLKALNQRAVSSVRALAAETGISKPSVVRLLAILIEDGYVQRSSKAGSYMLTRNVLELSAGYREDALLECAAGPLMEALTAQAGWPLALGMFEHGAMVVRYSTIPSSRLSWYRTTLHHRLALLGSAMGLVFLAFSEQPVRAALLSSLQTDETVSVERREELFAQIKSRGYSVRKPTKAHPTLSVSVPLLNEERVMAALSITLFGRAMSADEAVARYLYMLQETARLMVARCLDGDVDVTPQ